MKVRELIHTAEKKPRVEVMAGGRNGVETQAASCPAVSPCPVRALWGSCWWGTELMSDLAEFQPRFFL
jgi:hypothetical protein